MGWMTKESWFNYWLWQEVFLFPTASRPALELTQPHIQWVLGAISPVLKWLGYEADHAHLMLRLRMHGAIPPIHHPSAVWCLTRQRDNFTFTFMDAGSGALSEPK
jgi:hypothetical protein